MFGPSGVIRIENAFSADVAEVMADLIWSVFSRTFGIEREDPGTWARVFKKRPLDQIGAAPIFDEILTDRLACVLDDLLGEGGWDWPSSWGDFLITFPSAATWSLPSSGWHQDWSFTTDCEPVRFCKAFVFLNEVGTGGGGTLVVAGSHRLHQRFRSGRVVDENGVVLKGSDDVLYQECDWLRQLSTAADDATKRQRFMNAPTNVDGVDLQVLELTGRPGDIVIIHPWLIHAVAPNAAASPRFMRAPVFANADI